MKLAMNAIHAEMSALKLGSRMLLQVHDELVFEVAKGELEVLRKLVVEKMANVVKLSVPLDVQVGTGRSWDEAGH
jgi:DNA polymerase-1